MDGAVVLEEHRPIIHSAPNGPLARYQNQLTDRLNSLLRRLELKSEALASEANAEIGSRIRNFEQMQADVTETKSEIISSADSSDLPHDLLKSRIVEAYNALIQKASSLRAECLSIFEESFKNLQPEINAVFAESTEWRDQLPQYLTHRLEYEVQRLNKRFLETRKTLIVSLYENEMHARSAADSACEEFDSKTDEWIAHRYRKVIDSAKEFLSIENRIDFNDLFQEFSERQEKFTLCFTKNMQNVQLIMPPDHFRVHDLQNWWQEVNEMLTLHRTFLSSFLERVKSRIDKRTEETQNLIKNVREQLLNLADQQTIEHEIELLMPWQRLANNYNQKFFDKLTKYTENRSSSLTTSFSSVKEFLSDLIAAYNEFSTELERDRDRMEKDMKGYDEEMQRRIEECEAKIQEKVKEINGAVTETDINNGLEKCKKLLNDIADEYRGYYTSSIKRIDERKPFIISQFETQEEKLLEKVKMRKTAGPTSSRSSTRSARRRRPSPRSPRRKAGQKRMEGELFNLTLADGSKYEELEKLEIIPIIDDFVDEEVNTPATRGRRCVSRRSAPRNVSRRKGKPTEPQELEVPKLSLFEFVPVINDNPAIWIYVPGTEELSDYSNLLRKGIITGLHMTLTEETTEAEYHALRAELSNQLQERIRMHAPRLASMDLNVGEARISQLETRKLFMEKHFKQTTANFNKEYAKLKSTVLSRKEQLLKNCQNLHQYVDKLSLEKSVQNLSILSQTYRMEEKSFNTRFQKEIEEIFSNIQALANSVHGANTRFMAAVQVQKPPFSEDENELCEKYLSKMNEETTTAITELTSITETAENETVASRNEISEEFERLLPYHRMDVEFLESLSKCQSEARTRYESLCFRNKQSENDLAASLNRLKDAQSLNLPPQELINKQFELIDLFRLLVIRRSKFLGILKSKIPSDPILVTMDFSNDDNDGEDLKKKPIAKHRGKLSRQNSTIRTQPALDLGGSLRKQIDMIGTDMMNQVKSISSNYYKRLKARKFASTRLEIEPDQKACLAAMKKQWGNIVSNSASVIQASGECLTSQIMESVSVVRDSVRVIFDSLERHYSLYLSQCETQLSTRFESDMNAYAKKRETFKSKLTARLADANNLTILQSLVKDEEARALEESTLISTWYLSLIQLENSAMRGFTTHLSIAVKALLKIFDAFVISADLINCPMENCERLTMAQLLKDKFRRENGTEPFDHHRPFRIRTWPQLNVIMTAIEPFLTDSTAPASQATSRRGRRTTITPKKKPEQMQEPEKTVQQTSLDTGLSRAVIVEQNRVYEEYEKALMERLSSVTARRDELRETTKAQTENWRRCVLALRPEWIFPPN